MIRSADGVNNQLFSITIGDDSVFVLCNAIDHSSLQSVFFPYCARLFFISK